MCMTYYQYFLCDILYQLGTSHLNLQIVVFYLIRIYDTSLHSKSKMICVVFLKNIILKENLIVLCVNVLWW